MGYSRMKTLIAFSGGLDSTYILWNTLVNTTDDVTVVYLDKSNLTENDIEKYSVKILTEFDPHNTAVNKINSLCSFIQNQTRTFTVLIKQVDTTKLYRNLTQPNTMPTHIVDLFIDDINNGTYDKIVFGHDRDNDSYGQGYVATNKKQSGIISASQIFKSKATRGTFSVPLLDTQYTKAVALSALPANIQAQIFSCHQSFTSPTVPCGTCYKCKVLQYFKTEVSAGKTNQQIYDDFIAKSTPSSGKWLSMKFWINNSTDQSIWDTPVWPTSFTVG